MKILLIHPPFYRTIHFYNRYFPFGLVTLATYLKNNGFPDVSVYDADSNDHPKFIDYSYLPTLYPEYLETLRTPNHAVWNEMEETIGELEPDVIGISIWTTFAAASFHTARIARKILPSSIIVMGGPHATIKPEEILRVCPESDYVIRGDGEEILLELTTSIMNGTLRPDECSIHGISYRKGAAFVHNPTRGKVININEFPFPDRRLLTNETRYSAEDMGLIMATRGCPYSCTFCATDVKRVSYRSVDNILQEISFVQNRYGVSQITFKDDSFTVNKQLVEELCHQIIDNKQPFNWECNTRVNLVNEEMLWLMKKAGCNFIKVGIESGSERILKEMKKGITKNQARTAAKLFRKVGLHWTAYFLIGVPGETEQDVWETVSFLEELKPDFASIGIYEPFPGTAMFEEGLQLGLLNRDMTLEDYNNTLPNHYYRRKPFAETAAITPERFIELEQEVKKRFNSYNRKLPRIFAMAKAKSKIYKRSPGLLWEDFRKYLSYRAGLN
jgi:anaerobic magnesium-protoporphyrin IX monomethyl ester cyclase